MNKWKNSNKKTSLVSVEKGNPNSMQGFSGTSSLIRHK